MRRRNRRIHAAILIAYRATTRLELNTVQKHTCLLNSSFHFNDETETGEMFCFLHMCSSPYLFIFLRVDTDVPDSIGAWRHRVELPGLGSVPKTGRA